jgi:hypothetical protein
VLIAERHIGDRTSCPFFHLARVISMQEHAVTRKRGAVSSKAKGIIVETWQSQANLSFFLALQVLVAFVLPSLGFGKEDTRLYADVAFTVMVISGIAIAWGQRKLFLLAALVGSVALAVRWMAWGLGTKRSQLWCDWWTMAAIAVIAGVLLAQVFRPGRVTHVRIQGAIAVYLLFGVAWAHAYHITAILHPGSFAFQAGALSNVSDWIYFSFVTLTTVGYGDITPVGPIARTLAMGEALAGQLYLAVMIARLVAMEIVSWQAQATENITNE